LVLELETHSSRFIYPNAIKKLDMKKLFDSVWVI